VVAIIKENGTHRDINGKRTGHKRRTGRMRKCLRAGGHFCFSTGEYR
jgi:hypothetical protein